MTFRKNIVSLCVVACVVWLSAFWQWRQSTRVVAINSALARIATLQYNLVGIRGQTLNKRRQNATTSPATDPFREFFTSEFENLRSEIQTVSLDDEKRWQQFASTWNAVRTSKNVLKYRLQLADEAQALTTLLRDEQMAAQRSGSVAGWLLGLGLLAGFIGFGWLLYSQRKQLSALQGKPVLNESETEQEKNKAFHFFMHAVREPLDTLKLGMEQVQLTLQASERTLAVPVEQSLFDNPLYLEKTDLSRRQVTEAQQLVQTLMQSQQRLEELTQSFIVHHNEPSVISQQSISLDEVLRLTYEALSIQAEEKGVAIDVALRCDEKNISTNRDELSYCVQRLAAHALEVAEGSVRADRRIMISLWDAKDFWARYTPSDVMSAEQQTNLAVRDDLLSTNAILLVVAEAGDVVGHHDENGVITKVEKPFAELEFILQTAHNNGGFVWQLQTAVEPDYAGMQWALYWGHAPFTPL